MSYVGLRSSDVIYVLRSSDVIYVLRSSGQDRQSFIEFFIFIPCEKSIFTVQYVYVETMTMTMIMTFFCLGFYPSLIETQALTIHSAS